MIAKVYEPPKTTVQRYVNGVLDGSIIAGRLVKLAAMRHIDDLANAGERGYFFDEDAASEFCCFFPHMVRHTVSRFFDEPFILSPWQAFCIWSIHGWKSIQTKMRRFRRAHLSVARKNGKTTLAAGMGLQLQFFDDPIERAAQLYCVATKKDQAQLLYNEAVRMVQGSPDLSDIATIKRSPHGIWFKEMGSYFSPASSDGKTMDGLNPHAVLMDELHEWREHHRGAKAKLESGGASRPQPLQLMITTAGDDKSEIWKEEDKYACDVLENAAVGKHIDDTYFAYICRIDEGDDPFDEKVWPKANPNHGVSCPVEYLRNQATIARNRPSETNNFIRYHCNKSVSSSQREFSPEQWALGDGVCTFGDGDYCHGGIDLGRSDDWAAIALVFPVIEGGKTTYQIKTKAWCARDGKVNVDNQPFKKWISEGMLTCHSGNQIDFGEIEAEIMNWDRRYRVMTWAFDPHFAKDLSQRITLEGARVFSFKQTPYMYNEPCTRFRTELLDGNIRHGAEPVLSWQSGNVEYKQTTAGLVMPNKLGKIWKIDGFVAMMMAFSEVLFALKPADGDKFLPG